MKFDKDPPFETNAGKFPVLNKVVNVANCWYYLSLLERFVDMTQSMEEHILKLYLVRAEYRYFKWLSKRVPRSFKSAPPPVDVAFFWQAHSLSPVRYEEDLRRTQMYCPYEDNLQKIHEMRGKVPTDKSDDWFKVMGDEPYNLTVEELLKEDSCALVTCIVCFNTIQSPWKEYAEWRTDHSVALQCHCCDAMFTIKHVGKANLFADSNAKTYKAAGMLTNWSGAWSVDNAQKLLIPLKETKALPFNRGIKPLMDYFNQKRGADPNPQEVSNRKKLIQTIQSIYLCTPYRASSIDLIQAVARQYKFAYKATKIINWNMPQSIVNGIRNYSKFLELIKTNSGLTAVPTFEIDLAWHTHMLHHNYYLWFTRSTMGKLLNHDDTIPEAELEKFVKDTDLAWQERNRKNREAMASLPPPSPQETDTAVDEEEMKRKSGNKTKTFFKTVLCWKSSSPSRKKGSEKFVKQAQSPGSFEKTMKEKLAETEAKIAKEREDFFAEHYQAGTYKSTSLPYKAMVVETPNGGNKENDDYRKTLDADEVPFDKENISFHDKREIKEFIKLNNDDALMDKCFAEAKKSFFGHIGTSTCGNTDYLDQWEKNPVTGKVTTIIPGTKYHEPIGGDQVSRYTKVFLTKGSAPKHKMALGQLPIQKREGFKKYHPFYEGRYNTAGDNFNWYLTSMAWYLTEPPTASNKNDNDKTCGGWSNCGNSINGVSCGGVTANYGTTSLCGGTTGGIQEARSSSGGGGHSSYGGHSSSSCGGGSSSCGSSCGGGGGSSCGSG